MAEGKVRIDGLYLDGQALAACITLNSHGAAWYWKMSYDESYSRFSPGRLLTLELTRSLLADEKIVQVDLSTIPDHPVLDHIWRERLAIANCIAAVGHETSDQFQFAWRIEALIKPPVFRIPRPRVYRKSMLV